VGTSSTIDSTVAPAKPFVALSVPHAVVSTVVPLVTAALMASSSVRSTWNGSPTFPRAGRTVLAWFHYGQRTRTENEAIERGRGKIETEYTYKDDSPRADPAPPR
jgi:hypothetical protein